MSRLSGAELQRLAAQAGLDAVGAAPVARYERVESDIRERKQRGLFADLAFTTARPEESCDPARLLSGARSIVAGALCYWAQAPDAAAAAGLESTGTGAGRDHDGARGRMPRYAWRDHYRELRGRLLRLGELLGGRSRVVVDENVHVDREAAARAGVGFYGKNTMLITREHGSWVVLGALVSDREIEPSAPLTPGCGSCRLCIDACPTGALDEPGVLDANRCLSYWTQSRQALPDAMREALDGRVYGCDACQDACPWNRGVEKRRDGSAAPDGAEADVSLLDWLISPPGELRARYERLYVPRNDGRFLVRNAIVAAAAAAEPEGPLLAALERHRDGDDTMLAEHAAWTLARLAARGLASGGEPAR